ncbi:MAG: hypothetical protein ACRC5C_13035 [Bacilli bacterium]
MPTQKFYNIDWGYIIVLVVLCVFSILNGDILIPIVVVTLTFLYTLFTSVRLTITDEEIFTSNIFIPTPWNTKRIPLNEIQKVTTSVGSVHFYTSIDSFIAYKPKDLHPVLEVLHAKGYNIVEEG